MKLHGSAALTPNQRLRLAGRVVEEGWSLGEAAAVTEIAVLRAELSGPQVG